MIRPCSTAPCRRQPDRFALAGATGGWSPTPTAALRAPDIVGNIRVDQAWGLFQISGAAHLVNASYNILNAGGVPLCTGLAVSDNCRRSGHPDAKWGGSVMAALQIKNIPMGCRRRLQDRRQLRQG